MIKVSSNHGHKDRHKNATELREINPYTYGQLALDHGVKEIEWKPFS